MIQLAIVRLHRGQLEKVLRLVSIGIRDDGIGGQFEDFGGGSCGDGGMFGGG